MNARDYKKSGNVYKKQGKYGLAIKAYNEAIRLNPDAAIACYNNRGNVYNKQGKYGLAIQDYNEAIRLKPDFAIAYHNRGLTYYKQGQYGLAIKDFNKAIRLDPDYANAYHNRGLIYRKQGQYGLAIQDYDDAIRLDPDHAIAYYNRVCAYYAQGQYELAIQQLPYVNKAKSREFIANEIKKKNSFLDTKLLLQNAKILNGIIKAYHLDLNQAEALRSAKEDTRTWLAQAWRQLVTKNDIDGNQLDVSNMPDLPPELWQRITTFVVGLYDSGTLKVLKAVNQHLRDKVIHRELSPGVIKRGYEAVTNSLSFFSSGSSRIKKTKEEIVQIAEDRCQKRMNF